MQELTKEEKEEEAAVNSLFRWSLAKRGFNMKSTGHQSFSYRTEVAAFSFSFSFSIFLEAKWHLKLIFTMNTSKKHFKELTLSRSVTTFDKDIFGRV